MSWKLLSSTVLALLLVAPLGGCQGKGDPALLFVQLAEGGRLLEDSDGDGWQQLVLEGVSPQVIYFSDRPERVAGTMSLDEFLRDWSSGSDSFDQSPPNAAMTRDGADAIEIVEIRRPVHDGATLTYETRVLETSAAFTTRPAAAALVPTGTGRIVLFIDDLTMYRRDPVNRRDDFGREDGG